MRPLVLLAVLLLGNVTALAESILITNATLLERGASVDTYDILIADGVIEHIEYHEFGTPVPEPSIGDLIDLIGNGIGGLIGW